MSEYVSKTPPIIPIGVATKLLPLECVAEAFRMKEVRQAEELAFALGLKIFNGPNDVRYVSMYHMDESLFRLMEPEGCTDEMSRVRYQMAGMLYGSVSKDLLQKRLRVLARELGFKCGRGPDKYKRKRRFNPSYSRKHVPLPPESDSEDGEESLTPPP